MPGGVDILRRSEFSLVQVRPGRFYPVLPQGVWAVSEFGLVQLRPGRFYPVLPPGVWGVSQREAAARRAPGLPGSETGLPGSRLPGSRAGPASRLPGSRAGGLVKFVMALRTVCKMGCAGSRSRATSFFICRAANEVHA